MRSGPRATAHHMPDAMFLLYNEQRDCVDALHKPRVPAPSALPCAPKACARTIDGPVGEVHGEVARCVTL